MTLYKRPGKSRFYWTRITFDGQEIRQSTKTANKQKAADYEAVLRTQLNLGRIGIDQLGNKAAKPHSFNDAMASYLDSLETKDSTRRRCEVASKALLTFFNHVVVSSIDSADVERYRSWRKKQHKKAPVRLLKKDAKAKTDTQIKPATVNRELMLLSGMFKWVVRTGKATTNPVTGVSKLREDNNQTRVVSAEEFRAYLMAASQPLRDVAVVMHETGLRPSEIFNLTKDNVDLQTGKFRITQGKTEAAKRRLTMSDQTRRILQNRCANAPGELLFPGGKKGDRSAPIVKLTNSHHAAIARAGIKTFRLYDLRHTFATHLTQSGVDLMTVKAILGHSRLEMVARYSHPTEQHQADAIEKLESFRNADSNVRSFRRTA